MKKFLKVFMIVVIALAACYGIYCLIEKFLLKYKNYDESELEDGEECKSSLASLVEKIKAGYKEEFAKLKKEEAAEETEEVVPEDAAADFAEA